MGSVKQLLTNAYDPISDKEVDLLADTDAGLQMEQHKCNATMLAYRVTIKNLEKKTQQVEEFLQLVKKARQLIKDENN